MSRAIQSKVPQITKNGLKNLGDLIRYYRLNRQLSLSKLADIVRDRTGLSIGVNTLSSLERGNQIPTFDTLSLLSASGLIPFTTSELFEIASEQINIDVAQNQ